ncbi:fluoride efflux transporter CrcB [Lysinibacillus sp. 54212]|uniref:fluoride efflux transporter CrcB n=1 Tax=Lysinibacillus sp. 54212 TaxID=3119829 RepID=UPI002FC61F34
MIFIALGGFLGAISRYLISIFLKAHMKSGFPIATFSVNILGSYALGLVMSSNLSLGYLSFGGIGFLGAFTTFSTFSYEAIQLMAEKRYAKACFYISSSLIGGILAFLAAII